jgi:hypothetical protein
VSEAWETGIVQAGRAPKRRKTQNRWQQPRQRTGKQTSAKIRSSPRSLERRMAVAWHFGHLGRRSARLDGMTCSFLSTQRAIPFAAVSLRFRAGDREPRLRLFAQVIPPFADTDKRDV